MRRAVCAALAALSLTSPATAFDVASMTETEIGQLEAFIRDYLVENPGVIAEAQRNLVAAGQASQRDTDRRLVAEHMSSLHASEGLPVLGNPDGAFEITVFLDYKCGLCRQQLSDLKAFIAANEEVRVVVREHAALGTESLNGALFALAVHEMEGQGAYARIQSALMTTRMQLSPAALRRIAEDNGLDPEAVLQQTRSSAIADIIRQTRRVATDLNLQNPPSLVIEDSIRRGFTSLEELQAMYDNPTLR